MTSPRAARRPGWRLRQAGSEQRGTAASSTGDGVAALPVKAARRQFPRVTPPRRGFDFTRVSLQP